MALPTVPPGFTIEAIAHVDHAREIAVAPNGDLFIGTMGDSVYIVPKSGGGAHSFVRIPDSAPAAGVTVADGMLYIGAQFAVYRLPYRSGDQRASAAPQKIAAVRTSGVSRDHVTTTVAVSGKTLYASVGSSCNACDPELDATRATVQAMNLDGSNQHAKAVHIRNAIALTVNEATGALWAGVAGQDELAAGHPYEIFDPVSLHEGTVDYGWPTCYEDRRAVRPDVNCARVTPARAVAPAYLTPIGAAFYPAHPHGAHPFPAQYWGGAFVAFHGSWHQPLRAPRVVFYPMSGDEPKTAVNWSDPTAQFREFVTGYQDSDGMRTGRPTGVAVGDDGDLFVADDQTGDIYRIRASGK